MSTDWRGFGVPESFADSREGQGPDNPRKCAVAPHVKRHRKMNTEKPDHQLVREELHQLFASLNLPFTVSEPFGKVGEGDWAHIFYSVVIRGEDFEYSLGTGLVDWKKPYAMVAAVNDPYGFRLKNYSRLLDSADGETIRVYSTGKKFVTNNSQRVANCAAKLAKIQKVAPHPAEVLASSCREGLGADESFENWCGNYGYEEDSRKAEAIYRACTENGKKARRLLSPGNFAKFAELSNRL